MERIDSLHPDLDKLNPAVIRLLRERAQPLQAEPTGYPAKIERLSGIRAVVFDVYGTLFISGSGDIGTSGSLPAREALLTALTGSGIHIADKTLISAGENPLIAEVRQYHRDRRLSGTEYPEVDILSIWDGVLQKLLTAGAIHYKRSLAVTVETAVRYERSVNPVWPMPEAESALTNLRQSGMILGIISNAQFFTPLLFPAFMEHPLTGFGIRERLCEWSYQCGCAKPSPELFHEFLAALKTGFSIAPEETVFVGNDMLNDITAAQSAGLRTILFAGDARSLRLRQDDPRCAGVRPDAVVTDLSQIADVVL